MRKFVSPIAKPAIITVGDLISQLCHWPDQAVVTFKSPRDGRNLHFRRIESRSKGQIEIELDAVPQRSPPIVPA